VKSILISLGEASTAKVLWSMYYWQNAPTSKSAVAVSDNVYSFPHPSLDLTFDDTVLETVEGIWKELGLFVSSSDSFLAFDDRAEEEIDDNEDL